MEKEQITRFDAVCAGWIMDDGSPLGDFLSFVGKTGSQDRADIIERLVILEIPTLSERLRNQLLRWAKRRMTTHTMAPSGILRRDMLAVPKSATAFGAFRLFNRLVSDNKESPQQVMVVNALTAAGVAGWQANIMAQRCNDIFMEKLVPWLKTSHGIDFAPTVQANKWQKG